jgi:tetratricopeptide (TPR) repeat protein
VANNHIFFEHFLELMRLKYAVFVLLLASMTSAQCQQTAEDWFNKGNALGKQGKYEEAIKAYDEAIKAWDEAVRLNSNYVDAWINKGNALYDQGKHDDAIKAYDEAIRLDPNLIQAWYNRGVALEALGKTTEANAAFAKTKELGYSE